MLISDNQYITPPENLNSNPSPEQGERIPRIIHYCWFGDKPLDRFARNCINSWKKYLPGFKIKCWDNSCLNKIDNAFVQAAIADKRWAFVADYVRLHALYYEGGIYFDTDVKLYSDIRPLLKAKLVIPTQPSVTSVFNLMSAVIATVPKHPYMKACVEYYSSLTYDPLNYKQVIINPIMSKILHDKWGYEYADKNQELVDGIHILDKSYFGSDFDIAGRKYSEFYGVHFCNQSWIPSTRGRFYNFCKSNDLMPIYKFIASIINFVKK